ncbi:MAG: lipid-binding SYLF domain-containing protein [Deltaproteobacteria bacterium]|nr:lipid-binding SYLF domain-containing protein [Deltaproteobacteria bacterium]
MKSSRKSIVLLVVALSLLVSIPSWAQESTVDKRVENATQVLLEFMQSPDKEVPMELFRKSAAVAVFPRVLQGAFFVGGKFGRGLISTYDAENQSWSAPAFFTVGGGSIGFQFGGESIDLILFILNKRGIESLLSGKVTLGGDVSATAGPVGRTMAADTDILLTAEIYSYSRTKGLFAGVSLKGAIVAPDNESNEAFYGTPLNARDILLENKAQPIKEAEQLVKTLKQFSGK